jgi:hypothetical protein
MAGSPWAGRVLTARWGQLRRNAGTVLLRRRHPQKHAEPGRGTAAAPGIS